jgi:drug/metabolite transporter (DMT)-like permease
LADNAGVQAAPQGSIAEVRPPFTGGMRHMLLGALCFSIMSVLTKLAGARIPTMEIVAARAAIMLALSAFALGRRGIDGDRLGNHRGLLVLRGALGFVALTCFFFALTHLPLADATVLHFTNPILTSFLAAFFLRERLRRVELLGGLVCLVGVVLVARPSFVFGHASGLDPLADGIALTGATFSALAYVTVRKLGASEDPAVVVFYFALVALPASIPLMLLGDVVVPRGIEWLTLLGVGVFAQLGQVELTRGLRLEPAGRASTANYTQVFLAYGFGLVFFGEVPSVIGFAGAMLIAFGVFVVARRRAA